MGGEWVRSRKLSGWGVWTKESLVKRVGGAYYKSETGS